MNIRSSFSHTTNSWKRTLRRSLRTGRQTSLFPQTLQRCLTLNSPETTHKEHDTPGPSRRKKTEEVQDLSSASGKTASVSPDRGGDDEVEEINGKGVEQKQGEVTPPRDEVDPLKKRKVSPLKPSSRKKSRATVTKMKTVLTTDDFDFIIAALNDASLEIMEKQEAKQEEMYDRIKVTSEGYNRPFSPATQCPLHPCHQENQSWEMSQPNSVD
jgi:hypothetical protein